MRVKKSVILAFLVAVGILLQLLESFVGIFMIVPGYKIGLANIAGLFALYMYDEKSMAYVSLLRIFLSSLMQGTLFSVSFWSPRLLLLVFVFFLEFLVFSCWHFQSCVEFVSCSSLP